ncbi:MAG: PorV/PorQ family protein [Ignavibacteriales bacterium]|nr:PorV/PorQ family protein [Ignavibacteriales bacterium]
MKIIPKNIRYFSLFLSFFVFLASSFAGNRSGTVGGQFLKLPTDARAVAMGGSVVAVAEGASSLAYNPSGMTSISGTTVSFTYTPWFADIQHSFVGLATSLDEFGTIGIGATMLATDDMPVTTNAYPEGTGEYFRAADYAFHLAYAKNISDKFSVGLAGKYIYSSLYNNKTTATSIAFDIGTLYDMPEIRTRLGVSLNNLGNDIQYLKEPYSLPTSLRFGAVVTLVQEDEQRLLSTLQVGRPNDADEQYNVGAEYIFNDMFALRGGYKFVYDVESFTAGFGLNLLSMGFSGELNYGYNHFDVLPGTHTISFELGF